MPGQKNLYDAIPEFLALCAQYGLYVEFVGFTGPYTGILNTDQEKIDHWEALIAACTGLSSVSLELVNELDNSPNTNIPFSYLRQPDGILSSHGSNSADHDTVEPVWDYGSYHSNDLYEWQRKVGHNAMADVADKHDCPATAGENTRGDKDHYNLSHAFDAAAGASLLCAGACCHTPRGKTSELWDGPELAWAEAWTHGAESVPLEYQQGAYHHRIDLEGPGIIRAYDRTLSSGRQCVVRIRN